MYVAEIEVELRSTDEQDAEYEASDLAVVSTAKLRRLLSIIDGQEIPEGHTVVSIIEAVRSELNANE
jgi:hypothetical protein